MKHILRYGTNADQNYFSDFENCYDIIAINASMAAFAPNALAIFVAKKTPDKEFFIDPMTHLFQHNKGLISSDKKIKSNESENTAIKSSIAKLINKYAEEITGHSEDDGDVNYALLREKIREKTIDQDFYESFTKGVLNFQRNLVPADKAQDYSDYIEYANKSVPEADKIKFQNKPLFLVAPYFYIQANDDWVDKNITLLEKAIAQKGSDEVYAQIVVSKRLFDKSLTEGEQGDLQKIFERYSQLDVSGYLVWIDDYSEHQEFKGSLVEYARLLSVLKGGGTKKIHLLYGSYFSILLGHTDKPVIDGIAHGLEYGETRAVVPVGGGIPRAKFYLPKLHKRVDFPDMVEFLKEKGVNTKQKYQDEICNCATCIDAIKTDNVLDEFTQAFGQTKSTTMKRGERLVTLSFSTKETKDMSLRHYLASKKIEFDDLNGTSMIALTEILRKTAEEYEPYLDGSYTTHLIEWADAITEIITPKE